MATFQAALLLSSFQPTLPLPAQIAQLEADLEAVKEMAESSKVRARGPRPSPPPLLTAILLLHPAPTQDHVPMPPPVLPISLVALTLRHLPLPPTLQTEASRLSDDLERTTKLLVATEASLVSEKDEVTRLYKTLQVGVGGGA